MMEELVRPFQKPAAISLGKRIPVVSVRVTGGTVTVSWGEAGTLPVPYTDDSAFTLCNETIDEASRNTEDVRIENPSDSSQFIMVRRAKSMKFDKTDKKAPVLNSDFNIGLETDFADFNSALGSFEPEDGGSLDHCKLTVNLKNNTTQP